MVVLPAPEQPVILAPALLLFALTPPLVTEFGSVEAGGRPLPVRLRTYTIASKTHIPTHMGIRSFTRLSSRSCSAARPCGFFRPRSSTFRGAYAYFAVILAPLYRCRLVI